MSTNGTLWINDLNGEGRWSLEQIRERYAQHCRVLRVEPRDLNPQVTTQDEKRWIYPVLEQVIAGLKQGDPACVELAIELLEDDAGMPFGRIYKTQVARALKRVPLSEMQIARLRRRIVAMLVAGNVPREFRAYRRLLGWIGVGEHWPEIEAGIDRTNRWVLAHVERLRNYPKRSDQRR